MRSADVDATRLTWGGLQLRWVVQHREAADRHLLMGILLLRDCRGFAQYLQVERRWHIVSLAQSLQSLELVHGLKELTTSAACFLGMKNTRLS